MARLMKVLRCDKTRKIIIPSTLADRSLSIYPLWGDVRSLLYGLYVLSK